jgi:ABC-2 type transport system permease protein
MRKLWVLARKEIRLAFRDVGAILTMLVTPLALTLIIAAAFGTGGQQPISDIPVLLLDRDDGLVGTRLVELFQSDQLGDLVAAEEMEEEETARDRVNGDEVAALVVIPSDLTERVIPIGEVGEQAGMDFNSLIGGELSPQQIATLVEAYAQREPEEEEPAVVEIYSSPDWRISVSIVRSIVARFLERVTMISQSTVIVIESLAPRLIALNEGQPFTIEQQAQLFTAAQSIGRQLEAAAEEGETPIRLHTTSTTRRPFNWLDYSASGMAILFLMFAVTSGGRTLLAERQEGTLPRMLVSPTPAAIILVGKMAGIVLTGVLQVMILWGATSLIGAYWGEPVAVALSILALVLCASGVGALIAAWARTAGQAGAIGTIVTLTGAALAGTFYPRSNLPEWVQTFSLLTPNGWGVEIFEILQAGKGLEAILPLLGGTLALTLAYYAVALLGFRRLLD